MCSKEWVQHKLGAVSVCLSRLCPCCVPQKHEEEKMKYRDKMIGFTSRWDSLESDEARLLRLAQVHVIQSLYGANRADNLCFVETPALKLF